jgi:hypothetical protein
VYDLIFISRPTGPAVFDPQGYRDVATDDFIKSELRDLLEELQIDKDKKD